MESNNWLIRINKDRIIWKSSGIKDNWESEHISVATAKKTKWFRDKCKDGCEICGFKLSRPEHNHGLELSHIISKKGGGSNKEINCLALCPNCAYSFDIILKPAIYNALNELGNKKVPENWKNAEGRK